MLKQISAVVVVLILWMAALGLGIGGQANAQDDESGPTIAALETRVAELEAQLTPTVEVTPDVQRTPESADAFDIADGLTILSYRFVSSGLYRASSADKATFVLGEMLNTTDQVRDAPSIQFVLLDDGGNVIGNIAAQPILPLIQPGEVMPFQSAIFGDEPDPSEWSTEEVSLCAPWGTADRIERYDATGLELRDLKVDQSDDQLSINGVVFNGQDAPAEGVWIKAAIYDADGQFSGWTWTTVDVAVPTGKTARFDFTSSGDPHDPVGVAGPGYTYELWVGFDSAFGFC